MKIESSDERIDELLKGRIFLIPRFQRAYSWEADHISDFWTDVMANLGESYFIGSMVVYKEGRSKLAVVDGQQRLTTITILLCAIREAFKSISRVDQADGLQAYIEQKDRENKTVYVLETETSYPYLQEEVLKSEPAEAPYEVGREEEAIARAYSIFTDRIRIELDHFLTNKEQAKKDNIHDAANWLAILRDTIFDLNVILVTLDNEDDAYLIFETLNTRGKDLALSDLLRNHFTKFIKSKTEVDTAKLKWAKVLDTIASSNISLDPDQFIVHSWQSRYDFVTKAKTFQKVKQTIVKKNAASHLSRFVTDAEQWRSIFDTEYLWKKNEQQVAKSLAALRVFKVVQPTPGILSLVRAYHDDLIKLRTLRNAIEKIEKFHFSFNAVTSSRSSGGISGMYSSFGRQVFECSDSHEISLVVSELTQKLKERKSAGSEFDAGFEQIIHTKKHSSQKALVQYILKKIAKHESQAYIGGADELTIEHLRPQSTIGNGSSEEIVGQIGNLLLVDAETNNMLSVNSWPQKRDILISRGYNLPEILLSAEALTDDVILQNTYRIAEMARETVWAV